MIFKIIIKWVWKWYVKLRNSLWLELTGLMNGEFLNYSTMLLIQSLMVKHYRRLNKLWCLIKILCFYPFMAYSVSLTSPIKKDMSQICPIQPVNRHSNRTIDCLNQIMSLIHLKSLRGKLNWIHLLSMLNQWQSKYRRSLIGS